MTTKYQDGFFLDISVTEYRKRKYAQNDSRIFMPCDSPSCRQNAPYKAPKNTDLKEYYHFCLHHIREYNANWNYFKDFDDKKWQDYMKKEHYGHRKTWKFGMRGAAHQKMNDFFDDFYGKRPFEDSVVKVPHSDLEKACTILNLQQPISPEKAKQSYKTLVKQYHPDMNNGMNLDSPEKAAEKFRQVVWAFDVIKKMG